MKNINDIEEHKGGDQGIWGVTEDGKRAIKSNAMAKAAENHEHQL